MKRFGKRRTAPLRVLIVCWCFLLVLALYLGVMHDKYLLDLEKGLCQDVFWEWYANQVAPVMTLVSAAIIEILRQGRAKIRRGTLALEIFVYLLILGFVCLQLVLMEVVVFEDPVGDIVGADAEGNDICLYEGDNWIRRLRRMSKWAGLAQSFVIAGLGWFIAFSASTDRDAGEA
jgi:hypothetical protein